jgi:AraC family transcriptional regulator, dual regulator of chb operon
MHLQWHQLASEHLHWRRAFYLPGGGIEAHSHDFAELFLIEDGQGQQLVARDGSWTRVPLRAGQLAFVHPAVQHNLQAEPAGSMVLSNLAISAELHQELQQRFFPDDQQWPWHEHAATKPIDLASQDRIALDHWLSEVERQTEPDPLLAWTLLADVLRRVTRQHHNDPLGNCPDWLREAIEGFDDPRCYGGGVQGLARLAGVGREHLSRSVRRYLGRTATVLVNELRLEYAKKQLASTNRGIQDIALDAGFGNLAHFHRLFKARVGQSPGAYRQEAGRSVV